LRKLRPDFKTIADFRKDNGKGVKAVFREFTLLCRRRELFGGELVAVDSTKIKAQNSKAQNYSQGPAAGAAERRSIGKWRLTWGNSTERIRMNLPSHDPMRRNSGARSNDSPSIVTSIVAPSARGVLHKKPAGGFRDVLS
jgi:hypothetical protein